MSSWKTVRQSPRGANYDSFFCRLRSSVESFDAQEGGLSYADLNAHLNKTPGTMPICSLFKYSCVTRKCTRQTSVLPQTLRSKDSGTTAGLLDARVLPFFEERDVVLSRMLTEKGSEYYETDVHEYEVYM